MMIDTNPFPEAPINMINLNWVEKRNAKATWEDKGEKRQVVRPSEGVKRLLELPQAVVIKEVVLCSKCQCECELEVPTSGAIIDQELVRRREIKENDAHINVIRAIKKETTKNIFQRLGGDSEPKGLSKVFRNYNVSEEPGDKEAKMPRWVEVKPPQTSYHSSARQG